MQLCMSSFSAVFQIIPYVLTSNFYLYATARHVLHLVTGFGGLVDWCIRL